MRLPAADNWDDSLPADDRARYDAAWQAFSCCRDCRHWSGDDGDGIGACGLVKLGAFLTPEDYTCMEFSKSQNQL